LKIAALIPAYNESENIKHVIESTQKYVDRVVVCDDGSSDEIQTILNTVDVDIIKHSINLGYGATLKSLFNHAKKINAIVVVCVDADGQHDPVYIPELVQPIIRDEADLVIGSCFLSKQRTRVPWIKDFGNRVFITLIRWGTGLEVSDSQSGYRAYRVDMLDSLSLVESGMGISTEILIKAVKKGFRIEENPVQVIHYDPVTLTRILSHGFSVLVSTLRYLIF
jgi:glycosyltransferase involved in cell wall biosynthesis